MDTAGSFLNRFHMVSWCCQKTVPSEAVRRWWYIVVQKISLSMSKWEWYRQVSYEFSRLWGESWTLRFSIQLWLTWPGLAMIACYVRPTQTESPSHGVPVAFLVFLVFAIVCMSQRCALSCASKYTTFFKTHWTWTTFMGAPNWDHFQGVCTKFGVCLNRVVPDDGV